MAYYEQGLQSMAAADLSTALTPCDRSMDKFGQFALLRPTYMDEHQVVFYEKADIAMLCERIGFDVALSQLQRIEVRQNNGMISLHVEFADAAAKEKFFSQLGAEHLQQAVENLVQQADQSFGKRAEEEPLPTEPFVDGRGKYRYPEDVARDRAKHHASQNDSVRDLYASREGPPSTYAQAGNADAVNEVIQPKRTVRDMQRQLVGNPEPLVMKIQDRADAAKDLPPRKSPLLREKEARDPNHKPTHLDRLIKRAERAASPDEEKGRG